jgi:glycosyltransferase involved in cell wall biosynthesis
VTSHRIGVDLTGLIPGGIGGSETYVRGLIDELQLLDSPHDFYLFVSPQSQLRCHNPRFQLVVNPVEQVRGRHAGSIVGRFQQKFTGRPLLRTLEDGWQRSMVSEYRLDVWFAPLTALTPQLLGCPTVITVHDLQHEAMPPFFSGQERARRSRVYPTSCHSASRIIAISEFVERELNEYFGISQEKVDVVAHGKQALFSSGSETPGNVADLLSSYRIRKPFCFYPANTYPHKNHVRLLNAFRKIHEQGDNELQLVLTGASQWGESAVASAATDLIAADRVVKLGHIPFEHLPILYQHAEFMVFPSLYEGFGIPLLEAMQSECPVLTTRCGSIPEVAGDAALFVDGEDESSIAAGILRLHQDADLRATLVERGRQQAEKFSYRRCAEQTLATLERAVAEAGNTGGLTPRRSPDRYGVSSQRSHAAGGVFPHATCVGRHNVVYDQSFLQFRCPDSKELRLRLEPMPMNCTLQVFSNGAPAVSERLSAGQSPDSRFSCTSDKHQMLRLDFSLQLHGLQGRIAALRRPLETRIQDLKVIRQDGSVFQVIGEFHD